MNGSKDVELDCSLMSTVVTIRFLCHHFIRENIYADFRVRLPGLRPQVRDHCYWTAKACVSEMRKQKAGTAALAVRGEHGRVSQQANGRRTLWKLRRSSRSGRLLHELRSCKIRFCSAVGIVQWQNARLWLWMSWVRPPLPTPILLRPYDPASVLTAHFFFGKRLFGIYSPTSASRLRVTSLVLITYVLWSHPLIRGYKAHKLSAAQEKS